MKNLRYIGLVILTILFNSCSDFLDLQPKDKLPADALFGDPEGVKVYMANLYYQLPIEDFAFDPAKGFNFNNGVVMNYGLNSAMFTDEAINSEYTRFMNNDLFQWWEDGYKLNRDVNLLIEQIPSLNLEENEKNALTGECAFIRAYTYYALVKRYGGVPLIDKIQEYSGDIEALKVPRSTEKECWDFILTECDKAAANLPESWSGGQRRATKWSAYALKSRVALHAASIAKYWDRAPLSGDAVDKKYVGIDSKEANNYYTQCIKASEIIIQSGPYSLYKPNPVDVTEAIENYREMFEDPNKALNEVIFLKGFAQPGSERGHNFDIWCNPNQTAFGWPHPGRMNPTLDLVDIYECYDKPGEYIPVITAEDGNTEDYNGYNPSLKYKRFDTPYDIFKNRDARLWAGVILPSTLWKDIPIIIQAGLIKPDGSAIIETKDTYQHNNKTYYTYGAADPSQYSGFDTYGGSMTRTGFSMKKFLNQKVNVVPTFNQSITDYIDMRYAEVLLNYAEAVVESNYTQNNAQEKARKALNDIRKRAGHITEIPLTLNNVLRERRVELAFENKRYWDLIRRREYHTLFNNSKRHALLPLLDLRGDNPSYIFVRRTCSREDNHTFEPKWYYRYIPGIHTTGITQNPQY